MVLLEKIHPGDVSSDGRMCVAVVQKQLHIMQMTDSL